MLIFTISFIYLKKEDTSGYDKQYIKSIRAVRTVRIISMQNKHYIIMLLDYYHSDYFNT